MLACLFVCLPRQSRSNSAERHPVPSRSAHQPKAGRARLFKDVFKDVFNDVFMRVRGRGPSPLTIHNLPGVGHAHAIFPCKGMVACMEETASRLHYSSRSSSPGQREECDKRPMIPFPARPPPQGPGLADEWRQCSPGMSCTSAPPTCPRRSVRVALDLALGGHHWKLPSIQRPGCVHGCTPKWHSGAGCVVGGRRGSRPGFHTGASLGRQPSTCVRLQLPLTHPSPPHPHPSITHPPTHLLE